ncbi:MAG TPA: hypothetical protein VFZ56_07090 [Gemmatimonadaceae bacterium]
MRVGPEVPTPDRDVRRNAILLILSIALTVIVLRIALHNSPDSDFDVAGHNIHHLFTGLLLIAAGGVPLAIFRETSRLMDAAVAVFGVGLGMALDEWVYLIATDGSNASYLLPVSLYGAVVVVGLACLYAFALAIARLLSRRSSDTRWPGN